jgi:hypothetical protein
MNRNTYVQFAPIRLREGFDERALLAASDAFQVSFVSKQQGIVKRILMRATDGSYADLIYFESKLAADRVAAAHAASRERLEFFKIMLPPDPTRPHTRALSFEHLKTYD